MNPIEKSLSIPEEHFQAYAAVSPKNFTTDVSGKSVIITGGGSGIGAAIAKAYAQAGAGAIYLLGRTKSRLDGTISSLSASNRGTAFSAHAVDVTSPSDISRFFGSLRTSPDILVNNAGYLETPELFPQTDLADYWSVFTTNVLGTMQITQAYLRHREAHVAPGAPAAAVATINTAGAFTVPVPKLSAYASSKAALARWSELMAVDVPADVARFVSIHPGAVFSTEMARKSGLVGMFPETHEDLPGQFTVWATTERAAFLNGRFVWAGWDLQKLVAKKDEIVAGDLLKTAIAG